MISCNIVSEKNEVEVFSSQSLIFRLLNYLSLNISGGSDMMSWMGKVDIDQCMICSSSS